MHWLRKLGRTLRHLPAGVWAAVAAALALLVMYLRGRRLEAELARAHLQMDAAISASRAAKNEGKAELHMRQAAVYAQKADQLKKSIQRIQREERQTLDALEGLTDEEVIETYRERAEQLKKKGPP